MHEFKKILFNELVLSLGCTEPVAIAYAGANAGYFFDYKDIINIDVSCSRSVIKNAYSVTVPNSNNQKGIKIACALGIVSKNKDNGLEVLKNIDEIGICKLTNNDVVRHPLVQKIVQAYDKYEQKNVKGTKVK